MEKQTGGVWLKHRKTKVFDANKKFNEVVSFCALILPWCKAESCGEKKELRQSNIHILLADWIIRPTFISVIVVKMFSEGVINKTFKG